MSGDTDIKIKIERYERMKRFMTNYKGFDIEYNIYGDGEWTVQFEGDDVWFPTEKEAKEFIDEVTA